MGIYPELGARASEGIHEQYQRALTVDSRMQLLISRPILVHAHQSLSYGMSLPGSWSRRVLLFLAGEQPDAVSFWIAKVFGGSRGLGLTSRRQQSAEAPLVFEQRLIELHLQESEERFRRLSK